MRRWFVPLVAAVVVAAGCVPPEPTPQQQVDQLIAFVERVRGHEFVERPHVEFVPDAVFRQHVLDAVAAAEPGLDVDEVAFHALRWLAPGDDLFEKYQIAFGNGVVGFYDPATKVLEVRGSDLTPYRREVVVHELTHALDDQLHDLDVSFGEGVLDEDQTAFLVAVEGSAERVRRRYSESLSAVEQLQSLAEQLSFPLDPELITVPIALLSLSQAPYLQGPNFVDGLGGPAGIDAMFERYPDTAEEAWDPVKYLADEGAVDVPTPPADGPVAASGTWGRFLMTLVVNSGISLDASVDPRTDGWAGDAYVTWRAGGASCIRIDTRSDTPAHSTTLRAAIDTWAAGHGGATTEALDPTTVRLTACA